MRISVKLPVMLIILVGVFSDSTAQFTTKTIQLKPIGKSGWRYTYGTSGVKSAFSLQIPIEGLNDPEVNKYYNSFLKLQRSRGLAYLPGMVAYIAAIAGNNEDLFNTSIVLILAGIPADLTISAISHRRMGKAIDLYNISIAQRASIGLRMERVNYSQTLISLGLRQHF